MVANAYIGTNNNYEEKQFFTFHFQQEIRYGYRIFALLKIFFFNL